MKFRIGKLLQPTSKGKVLGAFPMVFRIQFIVEVHGDLGITFSHKLHKSYGLLTHNNHLTIINLYFKVSIFFFSMLISDVMVKFKMQQRICSNHTLGVLPIFYCPKVEFFSHVMFMCTLTLTSYVSTLSPMFTDFCLELF